jgi:hypothetical protein
MSPPQTGHARADFDDDRRPLMAQDDRVADVESWAFPAEDLDVGATDADSGSAEEDLADTHQWHRQHDIRNLSR